MEICSLQFRRLEVSRLLDIQGASMVRFWCCASSWFTDESLTVSSRGGGERISLLSLPTWGLHQYDLLPLKGPMAIYHHTGDWGLNIWIWRENKHVVHCNEHLIILIAKILNFTEMKLSYNFCQVFVVCIYYNNNIIKLYLC